MRHTPDTYLATCLHLMDPLISILALVVVGILLLLVEIFLPGGICGILGGVCVIAGVIISFGQSITLGLQMTAASVVLGLLGLWAWCKYFPDSRVGKQMFLQTSAEDWHGYDEANDGLLGCRGVAHSDLRPAGLALINNKRVDVVSDGTMIAKGTSIEVLEVEGNRIVVAPTPAEETLSQPQKEPLT
ncbi:MAG: membrane-bound serine protease (ClpP class) [Rhodothermales bacterium]|jgi:membrane-bound serine protease (ClpP class)